MRQDRIYRQPHKTSPLFRAATPQYPSMQNREIKAVIRKPHLQYKIFSLVSPGQRPGSYFAVQVAMGTVWLSSQNRGGSRAFSRNREAASRTSQNITESSTFTARNKPSQNNITSKEQHKPRIIVKKNENLSEQEERKQSNTCNLQLEAYVKGLDNI